MTVDPNKYCCLCAKDGNGLENIFETKETTLIPVVKKFFQITIHKLSVFQFICSQCQRKLMELEEFYKEVEEGQQVLKSFSVGNCKPIFFPKEIKEESEDYQTVKVEPSFVSSKPQTTAKKKSKGSATFTTKSLLTNFERDKMINDYFNFTCPKCVVKLPGWQEYKVHIQRHHKDTLQLTFPCCCYELRLERKFLMAHLIYHINPDELKCKCCNKQFMTAINKQRHEMAHQKTLQGLKYKKERHGILCKLCGRVLSDRGAYRMHRLVHMSEEEREKLKAQCDFCKKIFRCKHTVLAHIKMKHALSRQSFPCERCGLVFEHKKAFTRHFNVYHSSANATCPECGVLVKAYLLKKHITQKHEYNPQTCDICHKVFSNRTKLYGHKSKTHSGKKYGCDQCEYKNEDFANMMKHRKTRHSDVPPLTYGMGKKVLEIQ